MAWPTNMDIAARLARTLTTAEEDQADLLLEQAIGAIADACGKDDDWSADLTPVPAALAGIVIEVVVRTMSAPAGLRSQSLGQWSESYPDQLAQGMQLTDAEERRARRIVFGRTSATSRPESVINELYELAS